MTGSETLAFALTVISTKRTPCARGEISCIAFAQAWRSFDCAALQAASLRMTGSETLAFALTVISTKRTPCARGEISFFVHYYIPGMEILRLRCAPLRMTGRALHC